MNHPIQNASEHDDGFVGVLTAQRVKQSISEAIDDLRDEREHCYPVAYNVMETPDGHITVQVKL